MEPLCRAGAGARRHPRRRTGLVRQRRQADSLRPAERRARAHARSRRDAGTAFDGKYLYQIAEARIDKIDPATVEVVASIPAPGRRARLGHGLGRGLPVGGAVPRSQDPPLDPETGNVLRTIESNRFVTGVTWVDGELWHGTRENDAARSGASIEEPAKCSSSWSCRGDRRLRAGSRRPGSFLLRRRKERQAAGGQAPGDGGPSQPKRVRPPEARRPTSRWGRLGTSAENPAAYQVFGHIPVCAMAWPKHLGCT